MNELRLTCKCSECEGSGRGMLNVHNRDGSTTKVPMIHDLPNTDMKCKNCENGKTVMVLQWNKHNYEYRPDNEGSIKLYILRFEPDGSLFICTFDKDGKYIDNVTESLSLNILYYEKVEEQECPECEHEGMVDVRPGKQQPCDNCTDGKVEVVTGKYIFKAGLTESE